MGMSQPLGFKWLMLGGCGFSARPGLYPPLVFSVPFEMTCFDKVWGMQESLDERVGVCISKYGDR